MAGSPSSATPHRSSLVESLVETLRAAGCVFAEDEAELLLDSAQSPDELSTLTNLRVAGLPLEHVLGWATFLGRRIAVDPGVFVPRRRSEFLVTHAMARVRENAVVVDLCCGTGALGAALVAGLDRYELHAVDIDPAAVRCARRNLTPPRARVYQGDLFEPLPARLHNRVDIVLANVPYVPTESISLLPPEAREHEPRTALDGGADGLEVARRVFASARHWLCPDGQLFLEANAEQAPRAIAELARNGLTARIARAEEDNTAVVIGELCS